MQAVADMVSGMGARTFIGTYLSTYTNYIIKLRNKAWHAQLGDKLGLIPLVSTMPKEAQFNGEYTDKVKKHKNRCDWSHWTRWEDISMSDDLRAWCPVVEKSGCALGGPPLADANVSLTTPVPLVP